MFINGLPRFDVFADPEGGNYAEPLIRNLSGLDFGTGEEYQQPGTKVLHVPDVDIHTTCTTFIGCLKEVKEWLDDHPDSVPIPVLIEFSQSTELNEELGGATIIPWDNAELLDSFDEEIRSVFGKEQLITPDHIRRCGSSLEDSVLKYGWPDLESARGRIFFLMDNGPDDDIRTTYIEDRPNLEGRVLFTNASPGDPDCAFRKVSLATSLMPDCGKADARSSTPLSQTSRSKRSKQPYRKTTGCAPAPTSPSRRSSTAPQRGVTRRSDLGRRSCRRISPRGG